MKLKYYLRGLGTGILFATLVMTISSVIHNNNLSEEKIIQEAQKLGMIMPEDESEKTGLFGSKEETQNEVSDTEILDTETQESDVPETEAQEELETEEVSVEETETEEIQTQPVVQPEEIEAPVDSNVEDQTYVEIQIPSGSTARVVATILYENGLIEKKEEFRIYMGEAGYAKKICVGTFQIPVGASYEEICQIVTKRPR